jgi:serine/threonine-protein kinase RsbW
MMAHEDARCRRFSVDADTSNLGDIRTFIDSVAREAQLGEARTFDLKVAVSEACANAVEHSGSDHCPVQIVAWFYPDHVQLDINDGGGFRLPSMRPGCQRENRGLGFPLMVALMDEVRVCRHKDGGTCVTLLLYFDRHAAACEAVC